MVSSVVGDPSRTDQLRRDVRRRRPEDHTGEIEMTVLWLQTQPWLYREEGQDLMEYALLISLIILLVIAALTLIGQSISPLFSSIASRLALTLNP